MAVLRIIHFFVIPMVAGFFQISPSLKGDSRAVCKTVVSYMDLEEPRNPFAPYRPFWQRRPVLHFPDYHDLGDYQTRWRTEEHCCPGYQENDGTCEPHCLWECVNGYCAKPFQCACNNGYEYVSIHKCDPICNETCINGECTSPDTCTCNPGYKLNPDGHTCDPECLSECKHGWCEHPNVCACHPGYSMTNDTGEGQKCDPICDEPCENGECVAPDTCGCNDGFEPSHLNASVCLPRCRQNCISGECTAPETCTCDDGHKLNIANKYHCEPVCASACNNGYCAGPNICACSQGYEKNGTDECRPICERPCVNGKCVAPDACTCDDGFEHSQGDDFNCEPKCSDPCVFGSCIAPGVCTCHSGYEPSPGSNTTCIPVCNETCSFGFCIAPDTCACSFGLSGDSCDEKLFCVITQAKGVNSTKLVSDVMELNETVITRGNPKLDWKEPECDPKCLDQLNSTLVNFTQSSADVIRFFVPIDSPCNAAGKAYSSYWRKTSSIIGAVVGIACLAMVVFAVYVVRMKRKPVNDLFRQRLINDVVEVEPIAE